jgi:hypothetical protein
MSVHSARASSSLRLRSRIVPWTPSSLEKKLAAHRLHQTAAPPVPSHIENGLHAVRVIGNFAAHPLKNSSRGEIFDVEPGEAEWNLDVIGSLFDFHFVQPAIAAKRKAEINKKLKQVGNAVHSPVD